MKKELHDWERQFQSNHPEGLSPNSNDKKYAPDDIRALYSEYKKLKKLSDPEEKRSPTRKDAGNDGTECPELPSSQPMSTQTELSAGVDEQPKWCTLELNPERNNSESQKKIVEKKGKEKRQKSSSAGRKGNKESSDNSSDGMQSQLGIAAELKQHWYFYIGVALSFIPLLFAMWSTAHGSAAGEFQRFHSVALMIGCSSIQIPSSGVFALC